MDTILSVLFVILFFKFGFKALTRLAGFTFPLLFGVLVFVLILSFFPVLGLLFFGGDIIIFLLLLLLICSR